MAWSAITASSGRCAAPREAGGSGVPGFCLAAPHSGARFRGAPSGRWIWESLAQPLRLCWEEWQPLLPVPGSGNDWGEPGALGHVAEEHKPVACSCELHWKSNLAGGWELPEERGLQMAP